MQEKHPEPSRKYRRLLLEAIIAAALFYGVSAYLQKDMLKDAAPVIAAKGVNGSSLSLPAASGQATLVYFFAEWCGACKLTSPAIDNIAKDYPVLAIAADSGDDANVSAFLAANGYGFDALNDKGKLARLFGVSGFPAIYVVDARGEIRFVTRGVSTEPALRARLFMTELLQ